MRTVDVTPTWSSILPAWRAVFDNTSNPDAIESMWAEFERMAKAADNWNAFVRAHPTGAKAFSEGLNG